MLFAGDQTKNENKRLLAEKTVMNTYYKRNKKLLIIEDPKKSEWDSSSGEDEWKPYLYDPRKKVKKDFE